MTKLFQITALIIAVSAGAATTHAMGGQQTTGDIMTSAYTGR